MNKAGGIVSLIAGIFGFLAAVFTLFMGGLVGAGDAAFGSHGSQAQSIFGFGLWGLFFSFMVIILGAIAIGSKNRKIGIAIVVLSLFGIVLGGTPVAICLMLSVIGGILCIVGNKNNNVALPPAQIAAAISQDQNASLPTPNQSLANMGKKRISKWVLIGLPVFIAFIVMCIVLGKKHTSADGVLAHTSTNTEDTSPLVMLIKATPSDVRPDGDIAAMFTMGSKFTDLQREDKLSQIKGKVIEWELPVYDVKRDGDKGYKIQTSGGGNHVGTFIHITPQSPDDDALIKLLKTDDFVKIKGVISDVEMRYLIITPAVIVLDKFARNEVLSINVPHSVKELSGYLGSNENNDFKKIIAFNKAMMKSKNKVVKWDITFDQDQKDDFERSLNEAPLVGQTGHPIYFHVCGGTDMDCNEVTYTIFAPLHTNTFKFTYDQNEARLRGCFLVNELGTGQQIGNYVFMKPVQCK
jgi:hypothetical protein